MPRKRKRPGVLDGYEVAWIVRQLVKTTDKPFREIGEEVSNYVINNEDLSDYEYQIGEQIGSKLEKLWPSEGFWQPTEDAEEAMELIYRALGMTNEEAPENGEDGTAMEDREESRPRCTCGIEIARAREMCTERDCFYK